MIKKRAVGFGIICIISIVIFINLLNGRDNDTVENFMISDYTIIYNEEYQTSSESIVAKYNDQTKSYDIIDSITGEIITNVQNEEQLKSELEFYKANPTYRANPPFELENL